MCKYANSTGRERKSLIFLWFSISSGYAIGVRVSFKGADTIWSFNSRLTSLVRTMYFVINSSHLKTTSCTRLCSTEQAILTQDRVKPKDKTTNGYKCQKPYEVSSDHYYLFNSLKIVVNDFFFERYEKDFLVVRELWTSRHKIWAPLFVCNKLYTFVVECIFDSVWQWK